MSPRRHAHYRPTNGYVGDVIPFAWDGVAWLFYLLDERADTHPDARDAGMPWAAVTTTDLVHYEELGVVLPAGDRQAADFDCYTGSIVSDDQGKLHLFYTGHNPNIRGDGGDLQVICHATSGSGPQQWTKHPEWSFGAADGYALEDWRDPFVYRIEGQRWQMLLATRRLGLPYRRSGVVARLESEDLVHWQIAEPAWEPHRFITQECPDLFRWGEWWYLVYSEFSDSFQTRYRISTSPSGPWRAPDNDTIDGRAFYAAKTMELAGERYFIGWIATKHGERDDGAWEWAGNMSALRARQKADGSLAFGLPPAIATVYTRISDLRSSLRPVDSAPARVGSGTTRYAAWLGPHLPPEGLLTAEFDIKRDTHACGLLIRSSDDAQQAYTLRLEPLRNRLVFDRWPRGATGTEQWQIRGDVPHSVELERPIPLVPGRHTLQVHLDHDLCVAIVDDSVALSARLYDHPNGRVGVFVNDGDFELQQLDFRSDVVDTEIVRLDGPP